MRLGVQSQAFSPADSRSLRLTVRASPHELVLGCRVVKPSLLVLEDRAERIVCVRSDQWYL